MWLSRPTPSVYRTSPRIPSIPFPPLRGGRGRPLPLFDGSCVLAITALYLPRTKVATASIASARFCASVRPEDLRGFRE
jgi:hypothetical protein